MEVIGFTLGVLASVQQAITTAESLKLRYEAFRQNPRDIERLLTSYQSFAGDLHAMDKQFRGKLYSIPQPQRRIFERHFAGMVESFDSAREKLDEVSAKLSRGRLLRVLRAKAQSDVCDELLMELRRVEGSLFDINSFLATANVIESVKAEVLAAGDIDQFRPSFPILTASPDIVLDFDSIDDHGNPKNTEGRVKRLIFDDGDVTRVIALHGMGGVGKSSMLRGLALHMDLRRLFSDGIHLINLGMEATHTTAIRELLKIISEAGGNLTVRKLRTEKSLDVIMRGVVTWFHSRHCLFLVDDLWPANHLGSAFLAQLTTLVSNGSQSRIIVSTRDLEIASQGHVISLRPHETLSGISRAIMLRYAKMSEGDFVDDRTKSNVTELLRMCGGLPVSLAIVGKGVRMLSISFGGQNHLAVDKYLRTLRACRADLTSRGVDGYSNLAMTFSASLTLLEERRLTMPVPTWKSFAEMHKALCVLKKQCSAPVSMLCVLWKLDNEHYAAFIARELARMGLAEMSVERVDKEYHEALKLHDVIHDFCVSQAQPSIHVFHDEILRAYSASSKLPYQTEDLMQWWIPALKPDYYIHTNLCRHLRLAERCSELVALLSRPEWLQRQLEVSQSTEVEDDFVEGVLALCGMPAEERFVTESDLNLVAETMKLSWAFLQENPSELCFQLCSRLKSKATSSAFIRDYLKRVEETAVVPWLKPRDAYLANPGGPLQKIVAFDDKLSCLCVSHDDTTGFCGSEQGTIYAIKLIGNFEIVSKWTAHSAVVTGISISQDDQTLVSSSWDSTVKIWNISAATNVATFSLHGGDVNAVEIALDNETVLSASADDTVKVWKMTNVEKEFISFRQHYACVFCVLCAKNGQHAFSGGADDEVLMWSIVEDGQICRRFSGHKQWVRCLALSFDGSTLASGSGSTIRIWDLGADREGPVKVLEACGGTLRDISFSTDSNLLVSGYSDNAVRVWDVDSGTQVGGDLVSHSDTVMGVRLTTTGQRAISAAWDGTLRLWNLKDIHTCQPHRNAHVMEVTCLSLSQDGQHAASGSADGTIKIWEVATGRETGEEYSEVGRKGITGIEMTSDGEKLVFTSLDGSLRIIDRHTAKEIAVLVGHERGISCLAMSENEKQVYTGSNDRTIRMWDLIQTDANPDILTGHTHWIRRLFVSKDRDRLISVSCAEIRVWNIKRRECVRFLNREDAHTMSERDIYEAVGEDCRVGKNLDVPLHGRRVLWRESGVELVLGTLEADVADWCFSPRLSTVCIGLASGQVAFFKLRTKT